MIQLEWRWMHSIAIFIVPFQKVIQFLKCRHLSRITLLMLHMQKPTKSRFNEKKYALHDAQWALSWIFITFFSSLCRPIQIAIVLKSRYLNAMTSTLSLSFLCSLFLPRLKRVFPLPPFQLSVAFANSIVKQYKKKPRCAIVNRFDFIGVWCCSRVFFATIL